MRIRAVVHLLDGDHHEVGEVEDVIEIADSDLAALPEDGREQYIQDKMYDVLMPQVDVWYRSTDFWYEVL
jgi:predicted TIM-barrel enzyme